VRVLVSGASGFIGTELCAQLESTGHQVLRLVRHEPGDTSQHRWDPDAGVIDDGLVASVDAIVNLSGASTGHLPWTPGYKKIILTSRVNATRTLAEAIARSLTPPIFLSGSAVGYYGDQPGVKLTEATAKGDGFLADVVAAWELAANIAAEHTRVVTFRTGLVVGAGGAFTPLQVLTRFGLGARIGSGTQHWPWISLHDEAAAIVHLLTSTLSGPVNLVAPGAVPAERVTTHLAEAMHRWHPWVIPELLIRVTLGEAGHILLLTSQDIVPTRLVADGFEFRDTTVEGAIDAFITG
jgi:uncharacterized protein (TIGR01777 family)